MRFLVDAQLPRDLVSFFKAHGHEAVHTVELPEKNHTPDETIRRMADAEDRIVVSKDDDFVTSHLLRGTPRRVLLISTGNISNPELIQIMEENLESVEKALAEGVFVELTRTSLVVHA
jgi:predicted nuclease of predicted toxin-antitoxin system